MTDAGILFDALRRAGRETHVLEAPPDLRAVAVPALAGRIFLVRGSKVVHRFDPKSVLAPSREIGAYNNCGGLNVWPAPEGGPFGWTYTREGKWHVQDGVDAVPFSMADAGRDRVVLTRNSTIANRKGVAVGVGWRREAVLEEIRDQGLRGIEACRLRVTDTLFCPDSRDVLIAPWTLEQFDASPSTVSFGIAADPEAAVNFDFYAHPGKRIAWRDGHFLYRTDGAGAGQIGVRAAAGPRAIGMLDRVNGFLVLRTVAGDVRAPRYFNIADNDQPRRPFSAADAYSIFNSPEALSFLELETVGGCREREGLLGPLPLRSETSYWFGPPGEMEEIVRSCFGVPFDGAVP